MRGDKKEIRKVADYAERNNFIMGRGDQGATILKPNMQGILGRLADRPYRVLRLPYFEGEDYVRHIQTIQISLDAEISGYITKDRLALLKRYNDGSDYAVAAVVARYAGGMDKVVDMLLDPPAPPRYVRGDNPQRFEDARWLMWANYVLQGVE